MTKPAKLLLAICMGFLVIALAAASIVILKHHRKHPEIPSLPYGCSLKYIETQLGPARETKKRPYEGRDALYLYYEIDKGFTLILIVDAEKQVLIGQESQSINS